VEEIADRQEAKIFRIRTPLTRMLSCRCGRDA